MFIFAALLAVHVSLVGTIPTAPENITVTFINPQSVRISWQIASNYLRKPIEKYIVTFKPTNDRVVQQVAGHSEAVILDHLLPNTQYQLSVTAVVSSHRYKSRQVSFKTLELAKSGSHSSGDSMAPHSGHSLGVFSDSAFTTTTGAPPNATTRELPTIRGVEVGIVVLVLIVWAGAIALFFNRWGKIRMLLPYQPDYKQEQLKVPGTGVCTGGSCNGQHSHQHFHYLDEPSTTISERCTRNRINSAIFVSSEGRGFDSIEFLRRHGSQSVLCRKARSAENISDDDRKRRFSDNQRWGTEDSSHPSETIELVECHATPSIRPVAVTAPKITATPSKMPFTANAIASAIYKANSIVGSISIEAPPSDMQSVHQQPLQLQAHVQVQSQPQQPPQHQTTMTSTTSQNQISTSASSSPVRLSLKAARPPVTNLPTLSISQPSPPAEGEFL